jgi:hypothetical protein
MMAVWVATLLTLGVGVCHHYNGDEWDYFFGLMFFAGIPFAGLLEEGARIALWGYSFGAAMLIGLTLFAYLLEYQMTGKWQAGV